MLASLNVCGIHKDILGRTICNGIELGCGMSAKPNSLCCHAFHDEPTCQYLGKGGCTVKSLRCALWICDEMIMMPLKSDIPGEIIACMGPTEAHPDRNYCCGTAVFPFINQAHKDIYDEAKAYRFLRFFRQGKVAAVEYAYATRDRIEEFIRSEALTPEQYASISHSDRGFLPQHPETNNDDTKRVGKRFKDN
jgi:hypothetical protein